MTTANLLIELGTEELPPKSLRRLAEALRDNFGAELAKAELAHDGLERLALYLQGKESVYDLEYTPGISYGDVFHQNEVEQSTYNFEHSDVEFLLGAFAAHEKQSKHLMAQQLALPAYEQLLKAGHSFNLLDARGAISVTERAGYIGRIRNLARAVAQSYLESRARLGFPMAPKAWADEVVAQIEAKNNKKAA